MRMGVVTCHTEDMQRTRAEQLGTMHLPGVIAKMMAIAMTGNKSTATMRGIGTSRIHIADQLTTEASLLVRDLIDTLVGLHMIVINMRDISSTFTCSYTTHWLSASFDISKNG